jgi:secreted trypsin-like serine protease
MRGTGTPARLAGLAVLLCLVLAPSTASAKPAATIDPTAQASIIGGTEATIEEFPSLAYIQAKEGPKNGFACTGSVIAPRVVLTAGHCIEDLETGRLTPVRDYLVATGVADLRDAGPGNVFKVTKTLTYSQFDPGATRGDAGILVLSRPTTVPPIAMATAADAALLAAGTPVQIAGWGLEHSDDSSGPATLRTASIAVQTDSYCQNGVSPFYPFYSVALQFCTADRPALDSGGCFGDSGGPAIAHRADGTPVEIGVISAGGPACKAALPNIFTRVDRIANWAAAWVATVEQGAPPPSVQEQKAKLPPLTIPKAKTLVGQTLFNQFGNRFGNSQSGQIECEVRDRLRVKCGLAWFYGPNDYFGTVTVFYALSRGSVIWDSAYKVQWVNDRCWFGGGDRSRCTVHTRKR